MVIMLSAMEQIVSAYVRLNNRSALDGLRTHRQRLIDDLNKLRSDLDYDSSLALRCMAEDLAAIDVGFERLDAPAPAGEK
jgi:hypothetical protein